MSAYLFIRVIMWAHISSCVVSILMWRVSRVRKWEADETLPSWTLPLQVWASSRPAQNRHTDFFRKINPNVTSAPPPGLTCALRRRHVHRFIFGCRCSSQKFILKVFFFFFEGSDLEQLIVGCFLHNISPW